MKRPVRTAAAGLRHYRWIELFEFATGQTNNPIMKRHVENCRLCRNQVLEAIRMTTSALTLGLVDGFNPECDKCRRLLRKAAAAWNMEAMNGSIPS